MRFEKIITPVKLGGMELRNRFVMSPMATNFATKDGYVTERLKAYYEERARGGVGMVIVEEACVDPPEGQGAAFQLFINDEKYIHGLRELVDIIHKPVSYTHLTLPTN